jgi:hypothetical protein
VVDQFGYRTADEKIGVIRNPKTGFDSALSFSPGATYALVDAHSGAKVLEAAPAAWSAGATDKSSGDQAWTFDFSSIRAAGAYFVLDEKNNVRSPVFNIWDNVYKDVLLQSSRMYYYQRDGIAKLAQYAGTPWADALAHPQDATCRLYSDGSSPQDLHGGWFDAGDQNTYTNWHAMDIIELLHAYVEHPSAFTDDTNIPESGNGVPDILDEVKWELDWMVRMQQTSGALLSIKAHNSPGASSTESPPSADTNPCKYGPATTSASFSAAGAFAYASMVFKNAPGVAAAYPGFAASLATRAQSAWTWAAANPGVTFSNTAHGLAGGEQELNAVERLPRQVVAAVYLFELTASATFKTFIDANYMTLQSAFNSSHVDYLDASLEYAYTSGATATSAQAIISNYKTQAEGSFIPPLSSQQDPYGAWVPGYWWGDNQTKAAQGNVLATLAARNIDSSVSAQAMTYAERYIHYIHGVNPLGLVYLSAMTSHGATKSVTRFFHSWFKHGSVWDQAGVSKYGPPPGYLTGGANPGYSWDSCCPGACGGASCGTAVLSPPAGQPDQKSYLDFNDDWPIDSWSVTEPDVGYQAAWVRLLSKFVD